ncbi:MAG: undecaprenyldiphospho-muramoylpentapeptide beta-N-acetylglucosaminyltransferase [Methylococcales bacterium]
MIVAGGTGGHVYPALAVARMLRENAHEVFWMGTRNGLEARVAPGAGFAIDWLSVEGFRGKHGLKLIKAPFLLVWACCQAAAILLWRKPDVVLGMGGFVSGPGGLMAWLMRIPLVIHEQNAVPGSTNRILAHLAKRVLEAFPGTFDASCSALCIGNPVRAEIVDLGRVEDERENPGKTPRILVIGGSQGARRLNLSVPRAIASLNRDVEVHHQSGLVMWQQTENLYREHSIEARVSAFVEDMAEAYGWADLVICRAGAMTISELAIAGLPAILVPFPFAIDNHQTRNGHYVAAAGAVLVLPEQDDLETKLAESLRLLLDDPERIAAMSKAMASLARPEAARQIAEICIREAL